MALAEVVPLWVCTGMEITPGRRFGRLTVIEPKRIIRSGQRERNGWLVSCVCGTVYAVRTDVLKSGLSNSCGCLMVEITRAANTTHGKSKTTEFRSWMGMIGRCHSITNKNYHGYGGRGIYVCKRWRQSFECFLLDMGHKPSSSHSVDRIRNDGPYTPRNCRWATPKEQMRNTRRNKFIFHNGTNECLKEWSDRIGISTQSILRRIASGVPIDTPLFRKATMVEHNGRSQCVAAWAKELKVSHESLSLRIKRNLPLDTGPLKRGKFGSYKFKSHKHS